MSSFVDLWKHGLEVDGLYLHAVRATAEEAKTSLGGLDFKVHVLPGAAIRDKESFFVEAIKGLELPDYGHNWDDFEDCLSEIGILGTRRVVIVWKDAGMSFLNDV